MSDDPIERRRAKRRRQSNALLLAVVAGGCAVAVAGLLALGGWLTWGGGVGGSGLVSASGPTPEMTYRAYCELADAYDANPVATNDRYIAKRWRVRGEVKAMTEDGTVYLVLSDRTGPRLEARCAVTLQPEAARVVSVGQVYAFDATLDRFTPQRVGARDVEYASLTFSGGRVTGR